MPNSAVEQASAIELVGLVHRIFNVLSKEAPGSMDLQDPVPWTSRAGSTSSKDAADPHRVRQVPRLTCFRISHRVQNRYAMGFENGLVHVLTAEAFASVLPPGVINFVSGTSTHDPNCMAHQPNCKLTSTHDPNCNHALTGSGRATMGPIMESGLVDVLGFIGGTRGADALIKAHPTPHSLKVFAQLEGKNLGIVLPDADLDVAVKQCVPYQPNGTLFIT